MGKRRRPRRGGPQGHGGRPSRPPAPGPIGLARIEGTNDAFELVHPRCVLETELDYREGIELWKAGDPDEARDALRYALQACHDNLCIHVALGRIALEEFRDPVLARGHFGYAVDLARKALPPGFAGRLPRDRPANAPFYEAIEGLSRCLRAAGEQDEARALEALAGGLAGIMRQ